CFYFRDAVLSALFRERQFDHQRAVGALNSQNAGSGKIPMDVDLNLEYRGTSSNDGGPSRADVEASSSGTSNERGTSGSFGNNPGQSSLIVNSREPTVRESSHRHFYQGSTNSSQRSTQQPPSMPVPGMPRNLLPFPFISNVNSRNGSSSSSGFNQDNSSSGRSNISGVNGQSSSRNATVMLPNLNSTTNDHQISNDIPPWTLFPYLETESGGHRGPFRNFPSGPSSSSSEENVFSSGSRNQPRHHQPSLRLEVFDDEWQALGVDLEGRNRLVSEVRQILSVLRRSENFNAEDYMLDPVINGVADLHDRHRDMRLDVDNMSYEELLALGERIGDVKTGLTEDVISKSLKQRKHLSFMAITTQNFEPCCICHEEYKDGEDVGKLDCGHEFHTCCIKQWLTQKNLCPICKMPGLST
ncbi:hypothetical protein M8C21_010468, partial [Ambrosia artemisiifolia]